MRTWIKVTIASVAIGASAWLMLGLEVKSVDHETRYELFIKSYPTTTVLFRSYMGCDECDAPDFTALPADQRAGFSEFCRVKYGFDDPRICNAIYAEQRGISLETLTANRHK